MSEDAELTRKEQNELRKKLLKEKEENDEKVASIDGQIKETKNDLNQGANTSQIRNDGEMNTAFFLIFADALDVFKKEIDKIKKKALEEKLEIYENIRTEYVKYGKLTAEMLENTALLDSEKNKLIEISEKIKETSSSDKENFNIKDLIGGSKKILDNAKSFSVSDVLAGRIIDTLDDASSNKDDSKEISSEKEEDFERNKQRDKSRNDYKVRLR